MKIALNIEVVGAKRGGAEKYAASLARALAAAGHTVSLVARDVAPGELPPEVSVHPVHLRPLPGLGWLRTYRFAAASEQILKQLDVDLILGFAKVWHQHAYLSVGGPHQAALHASRDRFQSAIPRCLWTAGKLLSPKQWVFRLIDRRQFHTGRQPHVIAPSRMSADHFRQFHGIPPERISVIYNGLDRTDPLPDPVAARRAFRARHHLTDADVAVLFVARNYALKGLQPLLEAFALVVARYPNARLLVCGSRHDGPYRRQAQRLGLARHVQFLGFVDDIRPCFAGSDLFAFPTFYDPCSLVVLEAMAAGLPVITTRQNGAAELLTDSIHGFVIDSPWATRQFTHRLRRLVGNDLFRCRMGREAAEHAQTLTLDIRLKELVARLDRIASESTSQSRHRSAA